jgi:fimbrial chaperone protein
MALLLAAWLVAAPSGAANLRITPVKIEMPAGQGSTEVRVRNAEDAEAAFQVETFTWRQNERGEDVLEPTDQLVAIPPLFRIDPDAEQVVRIGHLGAPAADIETSYRLVLTELPLQKAEAGGPAVRVRLRVVLPVFIGPAEGPAAADLRVESVTREGDAIRLALANLGGGHDRLAHVRLLNAAGATLAEAAQALYVLGRSEISLVLKEPEGARARSVEVTTLNGETFQRDVPDRP